MVDRVHLSPEMPKASATLEPQSPGRRIPQTHQGRGNVPKPKNSNRMR